MEGIHHQSNITFVINTQDMTLINQICLIAAIPLTSLL